MKPNNSTQFVKYQFCFALKLSTVYTAKIEHTAVLLLTDYISKSENNMITVEFRK